MDSTQDQAQKEFIYGRCYQLVLDKSRAISRAPRRAELALAYARARTKDQIIEEAKQIIKTSKNTAAWATALLHVNVLVECDEYYGRCIQFLLDSNHKRQLAELITLGKEKVEEMAHSERTKQLFPKPGKLKFNTSKMCDYMCDDGCTWTYGNKRCSGDNRRYMLEWEALSSLDETYVYAYPEPY
jgi:hypothetical protein